MGDIWERMELRIGKIQLENFRNIVHGEIHLLDIPILIVYDKNGKGKTTIHESIIWGMSGEIHRYNNSNYKKEYATIDALYNLNGRGRLNVNLVLEDGDDVLSLSINRKRRKRTYLTPSEIKNGSDLRFHVNNEVLSGDDYREKFSIFFNSHPDTIQTTNFLSQELINEGLVTDTTLRGNVFSSILSIDWMEEMQNTIDDEIKRLRSIIKENNIKIAQATLDFGQSKLNVLLQEIRDKTIEYREKGMKFRKKDSISILDLLDRLILFSTKAGYTEKINEFKSEIDLVENDVKISNKKINGWMKYLDTDIAKLQSRIGVLEKQVNSDSISLEKYEKLFDQFHSEEEKLSEIKESLDKTIDNESKQESSISSIEEEIGLLVNNQKLLNTLFKFLQKVYGDEIPKLLSKKDIQLKYNEINQETEEIKKVEEELKSKIKSSNAIFNEITTKQLLVEELQQKMKFIQFEG